MRRVVISCKGGWVGERGGRGREGGGGRGRRERERERERVVYSV